MTRMRRMTRMTRMIKVEINNRVALNKENVGTKKFLKLISVPARLFGM